MTHLFQLDLPLLPETATPEEAADRLIQTNRSAALVSVGPVFRIVDDRSIVDALAAGEKDLTKLTQAFTPPLILRPEYDLHLAHRPGFVGLILESTTADSAVLHATEYYLSERMLSWPRVVKCSNNLHFYPPLSRNPENPTQCRLCGGEVPR